MIIQVDPHPLLDLAAVATEHPAPLGVEPSPVFCLYQMDHHGPDLSWAMP